MRNIIACFFIFSILVGSAQEQSIKVGLLHQNKLFFFSAKITRGNYDLLIDRNKVGEVSTGQILQFAYGKQITVTLNGKSLSGQEIKLIGNSYVNNFELSSNYGKNVKYEDQLWVYHSSTGLKLVNYLPIEHYVSGVVEGEAGYALPQEFYKLQAILSRTYALKNMDRHSSEGFNLCDKVHCQVYHHRCSKAQIQEATLSTNSLVVVDNDLQLINTIFHSNCGGQTCNSEDVWNQPLSYLRCVQDSFCINSSKANWIKPIPKTKLNSYFNLQPNHESYQSLFQLCQVDDRLAGEDLLSVPLTKIRKDFDLRSTYFYLEDAGDSVLFIGRGYGHGVGLCQQGGIEMAKKGYSYVDILKHYYQGIHIINRRAIRFFLN